jgi:hypothetical protein
VRETHKFREHETPKSRVRDLAKRTVETLHPARVGDSLEDVRSENTPKGVGGRQKARGNEDSSWNCSAKIVVFF